jgi:hypothetical protein
MLRRHSLFNRAASAFALLAALAIAPAGAQVFPGGGGAPPTNPTSSLTLTSATTAYAAGQLIANNATAASVVVPSFTLPAAVIVPRVRIAINDATSTAWGGVGIRIDLWSAAPTFANGDRGAFSVATGTANHLAGYTCTLSAEYGDGVYASCPPTEGTAPAFAVTGSPIFWTAQTLGASGVTGASKTMTLTAEIVQ